MQAVETSGFKLSEMLPVFIGTFVARDGQAYRVMQRQCGRTPQDIIESQKDALDAITDYMAGRAQGIFLGGEFQLEPVIKKGE